MNQQQQSSDLQKPYDKQVIKKKSYEKPEVISTISFKKLHKTYLVILGFWLPGLFKPKNEIKANLTFVIYLVHSCYNHIKLQKIKYIPPPKNPVLFFPNYSPK